jgi:hypothetical protein
MTAPQYPPGTTYLVVQQKGMTYGVEIRKPHGPPITISGFRSEREAMTWMWGQKRKTKEAKGH